MADVGAPTCEATVSPLLASLLAGQAAAAEPPVPAPPPAKPVAPEVGQNPPLPPKTATCGPRWPSIALRADGQRPVRINAMLLCRTAVSTPVSQTTGLTVTVQLFLTETGGIVAQAQCLPDDEVAAWPLHKVAPVTTEDDLVALVAAVSPRNCLALAAGAQADARPVPDISLPPLPGLAWCETPYAKRT